MTKPSRRLLFEQLETRDVMASFFVEPDGVPGPCSAVQPCDLQTGLNLPVAQPGDVIHVGGGTYRGSFSSNLKGTAAKPITVQPVKGEHPVIDLYNGDRARDVVFRIDGEHSTFDGFEVFSSDPNRESQQPTPWPTDVNRGSVDVRGAFIQIRHFVVHDLGGTGIGSGAYARGGEIYGSVIYNVGWLSVDRPHGHGMYVQNVFPEPKRIEANVIFNTYAAGIHAYGERVAVSNIQIVGNTIVNAGGGQGVNFDRWPGILVGGGLPAENTIIRNNRTFQNGDGVIDLGYLWGSANNGRIDVTGNYLVGMIRFNQPFTPTTVTNNTIVAASGPFIEMRPTATIPTVRDNTLVRTPNGSQAFVESDRYQAGRFVVTAYNWDRAPTITIGLPPLVPGKKAASALHGTSILPGIRAGERIQVRNALDPLGDPVYVGIWNGRSVTVPAVGTDPDRPIGSPRPGASVDSRFQAFVISRAA